MKKLALPALLCVLCACGGYKKTAITLPDGFVIKAEIADTAQKAERGLMFREYLAEDSGMLFVFEEEEPRVFWMKNTFIDLDIIFINADGSVYSVAAGVPRSYSYTPEHQVAYVPGYGRYVLELAAGGARRHKITEGSKIKFELK
ncbi:MAG: DUF192 domain-containing protein [Elusimicrobiota bacterium]|jgi:uncharacterized membrane protein (UPF0127 family)|nr:DUF192 domain-containing protein [Elusimicrobiota bacterium]